MPHRVQVGNDFKKAMQNGTLRFRNRGNSLKSILVVGGVEECEDGVLCEDDSLYLATLLQSCFDLGISIRAPETVVISNLRNGDDFLKDDIKADIVLFANIFYHAHHNAQYQSPLAHQQHVWKNALARTNAKVVGNVTSMGLELPSAQLIGPCQSKMTQTIIGIPTCKIDVLVRQ